MTERTPDFPLHRLNIPRTKLWLISPTNRRRTAESLAKIYRGGVGVCSATLYLIAFVDPRGNIRDLVSPLRRYELWQIANKPKAITECPCREYFDPEVQGPYSERGSNAGHHPLCQFERTAQKVFVEAQGRAANRIGLSFENGVPIIGAEPLKTVIKPLTPQARPDEWEKIRREYQGK